MSTQKPKRYRVKEIYTMTRWASVFANSPEEAEELIKQGKFMEYFLDGREFVFQQRLWETFEEGKTISTDALKILGAISFEEKKEENIEDIYI